MPRIKQLGVVIQDPVEAASLRRVLRRARRRERRLWEKGDIRLMRRRLHSDGRPKGAAKEVSR